MQLGKNKLAINEENSYVLIYVNPKIYPLDVIYSAAYVFLDRAYILLDGDPKKEIIVELRFKEKTEGKSKGKKLEKLGREFGNELLNYADYKQRAEKTKEIKQLLLQRALLTNDASLKESEENAGFDNSSEELEEDKSYLEDPEGIAIPWEEKYGSKEVKSKKKVKKK